MGKMRTLEERLKDSKRKTEMLEKKAAIKKAQEELKNLRKKR